MQKHISPACGGVVSDEEEIIAGRRDRGIAACAGGVRELGPEGGAGCVAGEDTQHLAVSRRIRVDREGAVSGEQPRNIEPYDLPSAGVDFRIVVDMAVVASVPEAHPNPHLVCAPVVADQLPAY